MNILSGHWDVIIMWKLLSGTARLYAVLLLVLGGYASFTLVRVFARSDKSHDQAALTRAERRISNVRQIILLLLLLLGMPVMNEVFGAFREIRDSRLSLASIGVAAFEPCVVCAFTVFLPLIFLHAFQWTASVQLQRRQQTSAAKAISF
jgi:hypothetical protein